MSDADVLIIIHPGSACRTADEALGLAAGKARDNLALSIERWRGDMLVAHGKMSDQLVHYARLDLAITNAMDKARIRKSTTVTLNACPTDNSEWVDRIIEEVKKHWSVSNRFSVTGAWTQEDGNGCVDAVAKRLIEEGLTVEKSNGAVLL